MARESPTLSWWPEIAYLMVVRLSSTADLDREVSPCSGESPSVPRMGMMLAGTVNYDILQREKTMQASSGLILLANFDTVLLRAVENI
jgi:hypothetical protein